MSDPMSDPTGAAGEQPSEEEVRAYLGQLRAAPVDQVVAEVVSGLLNAAQVKLGRRDARLLIDLADALVERGRDRLPDELTSQVDRALSQLRLAQVDAEKEVATAARQGHDEPSDLGDGPGRSGDEPASAPPGSGSASSGPAGSGPAGSGPAGQPSSSPTDRLWIPGR